MKTQKILMFIPIVNMINVFMWFAAVIKYPSSFKRYFITLLKCVGVMIVITIFRFILLQLVESVVVQNIALFCSIYLYFFVFSYTAVKAQIQIEKEREREDNDS